MLSPDNRHVFVIIAERPAGAKTAMVSNNLRLKAGKVTNG
jgi:hypothetical protein